MWTCLRTLHYSANMNQLFHDEKTMKPEFEQAWGAALKEGDDRRTLILDGKIIAQKIGFPGVSLTAVQDVISDLKRLAAKIEVEIAYFYTQVGQSMAANKFSFLKRDILDNVARLEKACQSQ